MFPEELKGLTPVEWKLIALNSCYGFITKYNIADGHRRSTRYLRHVKRHIIVTKVLPHPLLKVTDETHVSWQGPEKGEGLSSEGIEGWDLLCTLAQLNAEDGPFSGLQFYINHTLT